VSFEEGLTEKRVSGKPSQGHPQANGCALWQRALSTGSSLPDPEYERKKAARPTDEDVAENNPESWVVGFLEECCWWSSSRVALLPTLNSFSLRRESPCVSFSSRLLKTSPIRRPSLATGCMSPSFNRRGYTFRRGPPGKQDNHSRFLHWCSEKLEALGKKKVVWVLIWDEMPAGT